MVRECNRSSGTPDEVIGQVERYVRAGARHIVFFTPQPEIPTTLRHLSRDVIPYFRDK